MEYDLFFQLDKRNQSVWLKVNRFSKAIFSGFIFLFSLICGAESPIDWEAIKSDDLKVRPQYESCQKMDISSLMEEKNNPEQKTEAEFCLSCSIKGILDFRAMKDTGQTIQSRTFRDKLKKRVIGQAESKIFQIKILRACIKGDKNWFSEQGVDWPLMRELCKIKNQELKSSIKTRWPEMRINRALSQVNPDRLLSLNKDLFSFSLSHKISDFSPLPGLTEEEEQEARGRLAEHLSTISLDQFSSIEIRNTILQEKSFSKKEKHLTVKNQSQLRQATWDLGKKSEDRYFEIMSEMPVLGYLETGDPNEKELDKAFAKMEKNLRIFRQKIKSPWTEMGLFLSLVHGDLRELRC